MDPDHDQHHVGGGGEVGLAAGCQPAVLVADGLGGDVGDDLDAVAPEFLAEQPAEFHVDGGHDRPGRAGVAGQRLDGFSRPMVGRKASDRVDTDLVLAGQWADLLILRGELLAGNRRPHQLHPLPGLWS